MRAYLVCLLTGAAGATVGEKTKTNVIFLMVDSMDGRLVDPASPVSRRVALPFLDRLAAEGVTFSRTYTPSPQCVPGRAAMLTGLRTDEIRSFDNGNGVAAAPDGALDANCTAAYDESTCARWAKEQRVNGSLFDVAARERDLVIFGKIDAGFGALSRFGGDWGTGFHKGPSLPILTRAADVRKPTKPNPLNITDDDDDDVHPEDWTAAADCRDWLKNRRSANFFLHCSLNIPHPSFATNATWLARVNDAEIPDVRDSWIDVDQMHPFHSYASVAKGVGGDFSRSDVRRIQMTYYAMCAEADYLMGSIGDAAERSGHWKDSLVVFASDHGEMDMEHRQVWKNSMYEASARVPLIIGGGALPPSLRRGSVDARLSSILDLFPTFADFLGVADFLNPLPGVRLRGKSLLRVDRHAHVVSQYHSNLAPTAAFAIIAGDWKYVAFGRTLAPFRDYAPLLYNLASDPGERRNVAANQTDVVDRLDATLRAELSFGSNAVSPAGDYAAVDAYAKRQNQVLYRAFFTGDALADRLADHAACAAQQSHRFDGDEDEPCRFSPRRAAAAATLRDLFDAAYSGFDDADWDKVQAWIAADPGEV